MGAHVIRSDAAPNAAPTPDQMGVHWVKTTEPVGHWLAISTTDMTGWLDLLNLPSGGGGGGSGEANTTSNVGTGIGLALPKAGTDLPFKTLIAGAGLYLDDNGTEITLTAAGGPPPAPTIPALVPKIAGYGMLNTPGQDGYYHNNGLAQSVFSANIVELSPLVIVRPTAINTIGIYLAAAFTGSVRLMLYSSNAISGGPQNLLVMEELVLSGGNYEQEKQLQDGMTLQPGIYWFGIHPSADITIRSFAAEYGFNLGGYDWLYSANKFTKSRTYANGAESTILFDKGDFLEGPCPYGWVTYW